MVQSVLPATTARPLWRRDGVRTLESRLQALSDTPLMDLAGLATAQLARAVAPHARQVWVLAGPGNNGGDGLEAATQLHLRGMPVQVYLLGHAEQMPADAQRAFDRARQAGVAMAQGLPAEWPQPGTQDLCIDALLGIGARRGPDPAMAQAIQWLNASEAQVLAIDLPTGLDADSGQALDTLSNVVRADHTLTMLGLKPGLLMGHGRDVCGRLWLADLGLPQEAAEWYPPAARVNPAVANSPRLHASHKGSHGDVAIVGGESLEPTSGMTGAAVLAAQAALHGGAGRVMVSLLGEAPHKLPADLMRKDLGSLALQQLTVVAGCGGGRAVAQPLGRLLQYSARLVLDADALNRLAEDPWLQQLLRQRATHQMPTVLTPHPLEAARLLGTDTAQVQSDRLAAATEIAARLDCCVVLKGSGTVIAMNGHTPCINTTGNGLLATGGTGDVLAGLTGARLAQHGDAWRAACEAVWLHGQAADQWPQEMVLTASRLAQRLR